MPEPKKWFLIPEHEQWLKIAKTDLRAAQVLLPQEEFIGNVVYDSQQSAEKALKGYLVFKKQEIKKTHDLTELLELCCRFDNDFMQLQDAATFLNPYVILYDDPMADISMTQQEAELAVKYAQSIVEMVAKKIAKPITT